MAKGKRAPGMIKAIIFDFDGVIADSNHIKTDAFVKLFGGYPQHIRDAIRRFHLQNGGMSRFDKFRYIYANFLKEPLPEMKFKELCEDFNKLVINGVINAPLFGGVEDFLKRNSKQYAMFVVSGTPQDEMRTIVKRRGLDKYFIGVYGSPAPKKDLISRLLKGNNYNRREAVYLGDSINDYEAARDAGVEFVARVNDDSELDLFPKADLKVKVRNIEEFKRYLRA